MPTTILCYGNQHFPGDEIAQQIGQQISHQNFTFVSAESPYDILKVKGDVFILDVVKGIKTVQWLTIDDLKHTTSITAHDLDLGFFLTLLQQTDQLGAVQILGIPYGQNDLPKLKTDVEHLLAIIPSE